MKKPSSKSLLALCLLLAVVSLLFSRAAKRQPQAEDTPQATASLAPQAPAPANPTDTAAPSTPVAANQSGHHPRVSASDMTEQEKEEFGKKFDDKIKPAIQRWCKAYAGHIPLRPEDVTPDKLRERIFPGSAFQGYAFVIDGTTLNVCDDHGAVYVDYLMAPASKQLFQLPKDPGPAADMSVSRDEILRLLKADSGTDFPPEEIAIRPTGQSSAMNGGVSVDVGKDVNAPLMPLPKYGLVFGPDGNLVCYQKGIGQ